MNLYQSLADKLVKLINRGHFLPGERLPSIRELARQQGLSISTVQRALLELETRGLVEAKPKSGYYVAEQLSQLPTIKPPQVSLVPKSVQIHAFASEIFRRCEAQATINLGVSYPAADYFPQKQLAKVARKICQDSPQAIVDVHFSAGIKPLRKALTKRLSGLGCVNLRQEELIVTNGCLEALSLCLRAVAKPGDTIAVESPGFVGLFQLIESLGLKALEIPAHPQEGLSLEALQLAIEQWSIKAVAIVPSFSNPMGSLMPQANRKRLVALLAEQNIPLIEDDLLGDLAFDGSRPAPCKAYDKKGLVLYCGSMSKTLASGLRIGWIAAGSYFDEVAYFKTFTNISAPNLNQMIVAEFLEGGHYDRFLRQLTNRLAQQMKRFQLAVEKYFPPDTAISRPQGGCILWLELPRYVDGLALFESALALGIAIMPGQLSSASGKYSHCIRLNTACDPQIDIEATLKRLADLIAQEV